MSSNNPFLDPKMWDDEIDHNEEHPVTQVHISDAYGMEVKDEEVFSSKEVTEDDYYQELHNIYASELSVFAKDNLVIVPEEGGTMLPLVFNAVQVLTDVLLDQQKARTNKVRALILKPRREGMSTYIGARYFNHTIYSEALETFILCHKQDATDTLFNMVTTFYNNMRDEFKPVTKQANAKKLSFENLHSGYSLGTAHTDDVGRSKIAHRFHGSEVAFWKNAEEVYAASSEIVGEKDGTEIILESTGKQGTFFEELWGKSRKSDSSYQTIFHAWFNSPRNVADTKGLIPTDEEKELMKLYPKMSLGNIAFRRLKLDSKSLSLFNREYPSCPEDAFQLDPKEAFISPSIAMTAANREIPLDYEARKIMGVDPSMKKDGDPSAIAIRQGLNFTRIIEFRRLRIQDKAKVIAKVIDEEHPYRVYIDQGGSGKEIADLLVDWGYTAVRVVPFKMRADNPKLYINKRNEMYSRMKLWLSEQGSIPNIPSLLAEISVTRAVTNNDGQEVLESKKDMLYSPNLSDACALTFTKKDRGAKKATDSGYY